MKLLPFLLAAFVVPLGGLAAQETSTHIKDAIKARLSEEAKGPVRPAKTEAAAKAAQPAPPPTPTPAPAATNAQAEQAKKEAPMVLDPVEVRKRKLSEFEDAIRDQEKEIIREKKLTVPTELDKALNDSTLAKVLAIFGGESNEYRANIASERVSMMEDEKALIEAINQAETKEEKQMLRKQLDDLKQMRRELEKSLR